jgi:Zn-dependent M32 family carboxypeptidase
MLQIWRWLLRRRTTCALGYDLQRGRLDSTVHPFEVSFTRDDVRITTRYNRNFLPASLFGTAHETGHALYEQGVSPDYSRSVFATDLIGLYAVGGTSFGMHESQSRLWEKPIVRSPDFWRLHFPALQAEFPQQLADGVEPGGPARPGFAGAERRTGRCGDAGVSCVSGRQNN